MRILFQMASTYFWKEHGLIKTNTNSISQYPTFWFPAVYFMLLILGSRRTPTKQPAKTAVLPPYSLALEKKHNRLVGEHIQ